MAGRLGWRGGSSAVARSLQLTDPDVTAFDGEPHRLQTLAEVTQRPVSDLGVGELNDRAATHPCRPVALDLAVSLAVVVAPPSA